MIYFLSSTIFYSIVILITAVISVVVSIVSWLLDLVVTALAIVGAAFIWVVNLVSGCFTVYDKDKDKQ